MLSLLPIIMMLTLSGCAFLSMFTINDKPGYTAGILAATAYVTTKDIQSEDLNTAIRASYYTLVRITGGESENDLVDIIMEEVDKLIEDNIDDEYIYKLATTYFITAKEKLITELGDLNLDNDAGKILMNFREGINLIITDTQPTGAGIQW